MKNIIRSQISLLKFPMLIIRKLYWIGLAPEQKCVTNIYFSGLEFQCFKSLWKQVSFLMTFSRLNRGEMNIYLSWHFDGLSVYVFAETKFDVNSTKLYLNFTFKSKFEKLIFFALNDCIHHSLLFNPNVCQLSSDCSFPWNQVLQKRNDLITPAPFSFYVSKLGRSCPLKIISGRNFFGLLQMHF